MSKQAFLPSPHVLKRFDTLEFKVPKLALDNNKARFPIVASLAPLILGIVMFLVNPNPMSIAFMAVSPLIVVANFIDTKVNHKRKNVKQTKQWFNEIDLLQRQILYAKTKELEVRHQVFPPIHQIIDSAKNLSSLLWCRDIDDKQFLVIRLGLGETPSSIKLVDNNNQLESSAAFRLDNLKKLAKTLVNSPLTLDIKQIGSLGVFGDFQLTYQFLLNIVLQLTVLHRPRDLKISYIAKTNLKNYLAFLEYLPHYIPFESLVNLDKENCLIFCLEEFKSAIEYVETNSNCHILGFSQIKNNLPALCKSVIDIMNKVVYNIKLSYKIPIKDFDFFAIDQYNLALKTLYQLKDPLAKLVAGKLVNNLPFSQFSQSYIVNQPCNYKLTAPLGLSDQGVVNISLVQDGPHVFIGGTTGSGKSEFIKAWILSLAKSTPPSQINFLLIDYKGGSALANFSELPHCVGLVTDLSPKLFQRTQISLKAELLRREKIFNKYCVSDLAGMQAKYPQFAPSSLIIVVDELAALVNDIPEFLDGLIDIAARGRSLGLHLVLATQRPSGVIKDNLRANTNLRIALRVADEADSKDIIGSSIAAHFDIKVPGRAAIKCGSDKLIQFQSPFIDNQEFLDSLIQSIKLDFINSKLSKPYKPWQEKLPDIINLQDFYSNELFLSTSNNSPALGVIDIPDKQSRQVWQYTPAHDGNLLIFGSFGSGKSTFIESMVYIKSAALLDDVSFYIISSQSLFNLNSLLTVGNVIDINDQELIDRLFDKLIALIKTRQAVSNGFNINLPVVKSNNFTKADSNKTQQPAIYLIIDDWQLFKQIYDSFYDDNFMTKLMIIISSCRAVNITVVLTADTVSAISGRMLSCFASRLIFKMVAEQDCLLLCIDKNNFVSDFPSGRAIYNGLEVQTIIIDKDPAKKISLINQLSVKQSKANIKPTDILKKLPVKLELAKIQHLQQSNKVILGVKYSDLQVWQIDLNGLVVITGPPKSGKTNLINLIKYQKPQVEIINNIYNLNSTVAFDKVISRINNCLETNQTLLVEMPEYKIAELWKIVNLLKRASLSIILQPDDRFSQSFSYIPMPRCRRNDFCVGRGLIFYNGDAEIIQTPKIDY
ncbi:MAG: hypothetical protein LBT99_04590 [Bifidobacteriaceae bacterium]|jgi:S-DNA-T family DNA segregation ATPase FtsK/SpoIIIE|nr:hypothetical protein [Bifidobacteriaceae bacterium]